MKTPDELTAEFLQHFKVDPFMWQSYVKYIKEMTDLLKAREEARINEYVRKASWEKASGLSHTNERFRDAQKKSLEAYRKFWDADGKASAATSATVNNRDHYRNERPHAY